MVEYTHPGWRDAAPNDNTTNNPLIATMPTSTSIPIFPDNNNNNNDIDMNNNQPLVADTTTIAPNGYFYNPRDDDDNDSALGDDKASSTTSLNESIFNYQYENGRRYHAFRAGAYPLPNDELEQDRMDMQHHIYLLLFGGELYRAPLPPKINRALDIGCGTGLWAIDFADTRPDTQVIATDLSYIQPTWIPPNLRFEIDDAEAEWNFNQLSSDHDQQKFDYIHIRSMAGSIADWPRLLSRAYNNLAPGGWIELTEFETWASTDDNSLPLDSAYHEYQVRLCEAAASFGKEMNIAPHIYNLVRNAGFANVREEVQKCPLSPWPKDKRLKELAMYMNLQMMESIEPYGLALFSRVLKWDTTRIYALLDGVRRDLRNLNYHMYSRVHCVYGQKPYN
ncbi:hypothetical protein TMatcc_003960 [Talaromyces marneffei ATCC 18224]|uniref:Methyltransferase n=2 Tax=Talaromyces marneffei TaxID=37727 RepID=B6Q7J0_TALMQ|nr:uncharacterized protein EYB26_001054 [Talaromyces marneffei]EEA27742.1 conserved hypothetical protein [Talaromyces marneffei ATCC 18224]KAE8556580.1 hypothetical protein EYB25_001282 [Talaromyces marneffei]QGA13405.1 hypothetical protein EYB26_001054 [Talaromyces marneffei]